MDGSFRSGAADNLPPLVFRDDSSDEDSSAGSTDSDGAPPAAWHDGVPLEDLQAALADAESLPRREHRGESAMEVHVGVSGSVVVQVTHNCRHRRRCDIAPGGAHLGSPS